MKILYMAVVYKILIMHKPISNILTSLLIFIISLSACQRMPDTGQEAVAEDGIWTKVHYRATVTGNAETKATLDAIDRHYLFEEDDLMYVVDSETGGDKLYGFLYMISGAGATKAVFEGDLMYFVKKSSNPDVYEPERPADGFAVTGTLVSKVQRDNSVYTINASNEGKIASGPDFGDHYAATFKEAVQKYSTFTAEATYGNPSFSLVQGTTFLMFSLSFEDNVNTSLTISLKNNVGSGSETTLFTRPSVALDADHNASFVAAFPGGTITLSSAKLNVSDGGSLNLTKSLASVSLQGNCYYNVAKAFLDLTYFTIQARDAATSITFNYSTIEYSTDNGSTWISAGSVPTVPLAADQSVKVRGSGTSYKNTATNTIFTSTASCYIYGDIMSLFSNPTTLGSEALRGAFKDMANIDMHPARPLLLSAQTLGQRCYQQMFAGSSITRAPEFYNNEGDFAANIPNYACYQMFQGCTALTAAPELPANGTIGTEGYRGMFSGCTAMAIPPTRLTVSPANGSSSNFREMFQGCTSLLLSPELSATEVKSNGCQSMFQGCTALTAAPDLPAVTVANNAYNNMFLGCSAMTAGPNALPATTMSNSCYAGMFKNCILLEAAPQIDAVTLAQSCFSEMFSDCNALRTAQDAFSFSGDIPQQACNKMFYNCAALNKAPEMLSVTGTIGTSGCNEMYSGCAQMRTAPSSLNASTVSATGYKMMFYNCAWLVDSPAITATSIGTSGCQEMFRGCTRLQNPPAALPATTLGTKVYLRMFYGCSNLGSIPDFPHEPGVIYDLPAGTSGENNQQDGFCFQMFYKCDGLTTLEGKQLFNSITPLKLGCFQDMFSTCANLVSVPENFLPATTLAQSCYRGMFQSCGKLERAPDLLALDISGCANCYRFMFESCKKLNYIKCLTTTSVANDTYTQNWVRNVPTGAGKGTFVKNSGNSTWPTNVHGIPSGWTVETETP